MLNARDPLVPVPITMDRYVDKVLTNRPDADIWELAAEYHEKFKIQMSGFDSVGNPITPPDAHVLDHLARAWDLVSDEVSAVRPVAGTVACPVEDLVCDLCGGRARYETWIKARGGRELVSACLDCMRVHGDPVIGSGRSVYLLYFDEVPAPVREICDAIRAQQGRPSIWSDDEDEAIGDVEAARRSPLEAKTVSVRLRRLWIDTCGPLLIESEHDLADVWSAAVLRRVGPTLVVTADTNFGTGDPFDSAAGLQIKDLVLAESHGAVRTVTYEYAIRGIPQLRRAKTSNLDIYHRDDRDAPTSEAVAELLAARLAGSTSAATAALSQLTVAAVSRHRLWLAVETEEDRRAIGATPGAGADLALAVGQIQKTEATYDLVIDPEAARRYARLPLS